VKEYIYQQTCERGHTIKEFLTEADAFSLRTLKQLSGRYGEPCKTCGRRISSLSTPTVEVNGRTLNQWLYNLDLAYSEQDEEFVLCDREFLPLLLEGVDKPDALPEKRAKLLEALCILAYDNTPSAMRKNSPFETTGLSIAPEEVDDDLRTTVLRELRKRIALLESLRLYMSCIYVQAVIFPMIGLDW